MPAHAARSADPAPLVVRYVDVLVVLLAAPFVLLMGAPVLGYAVGAAAWLIHRAAGVLIERHARERGPKGALGLELGGVIARTWFVGLTILAVGLAGEREDGLTAAVLLLAAFTLYFVASLLLRPHERKTTRP